LRAEQSASLYQQDVGYFLKWDDYNYMASIDYRTSIQGENEKFRRKKSVSLLVHILSSCITPPIHRKCSLTTSLTVLTTRKRRSCSNAFNVTAFLCFIRHLPVHGSKYVWNKMEGRIRTMATASAVKAGQLLRNGVSTHSICWPAAFQKHKAPSANILMVHSTWSEMILWTYKPIPEAIIGDHDLVCFSGVDQVVSLIGLE
jgi:hypothetical protein